MDGMGRDEWDELVGSTPKYVTVAFDMGFSVMGPEWNELE